MTTDHAMTTAAVTTGTATTGTATTGTGSMHTTEMQVLPLEGRRPREDALPEHMQYRDEGCDLFASCLACPLPRCRYDEPGGARAMMNRLRDGEIRRLRFESGLAIDDISARFRVSRRTVFRVLQQGRPLRLDANESRGCCEGGKTRECRDDC